MLGNGENKSNQGQSHETSYFPDSISFPSIDLWFVLEGPNRLSKIAERVATSIDESRRQSPPYRNIYLEPAYSPNEYNLDGMPVFPNSTFQIRKLRVYAILEEDPEKKGKIDFGMHAKAYYSLNRDSVSASSSGPPRWSRDLVAKPSAWNRRFNTPLPYWTLKDRDMLANNLHMSSNDWFEDNENNRKRNVLIFSNKKNPSHGEIKMELGMELLHGELMRTVIISPVMKGVDGIYQRSTFEIEPKDGTGHMRNFVFVLGSILKGLANESSRSTPSRLPANQGYFNFYFPSK